MPSLSQSSSGNQELDEGTLPRCSVTSPLPVPTSVSGCARGCALCPFWGGDLWLRPYQWMSTIQSLRMSLVRNWKPFCSLVWDAISGVEFASYRLWLVPASPLPPAGGWAGPQLASSSLVLLSSFVLRTGRLYLRLGLLEG